MQVAEKVINADDDTRTMTSISNINSSLTVLQKRYDFVLNKFNTFETWHNKSCLLVCSCSDDHSTSDKLKASSNNSQDLEESFSLISFLKEKNKSMEGELKEMQERYSEISLKFAEVEGERQQLVMALRNLKNAKKSS